jgi:NAD+ diphosphatase
LTDGSTEVAWVGQKLGLDYFAVDISELNDSDELYANLSDACDAGQVVVRAPLRQFGDLMASAEEAALYATANGLVLFHRAHPFCSKCGAATVAAKAGGCRRCTSATCKTSVYPRIDTAAIMLVTSACGGYALLGRKRAWPAGRWSTLAGFAELGETLEECVTREVFEEAGVRVDLASVRFVASQPWPFPRSLMAGFTARAVASDAAVGVPPPLPAIDVDTNELEDAQWFAKDYVRQRLGRAVSTSGLDFTPSDDEAEFHIPGPASLARSLISTWATEVPE